MRKSGDLYVHRFRFSGTSPSYITTRSPQYVSTHWYISVSFCSDWSFKAVSRSCYRHGQGESRHHRFWELVNKIKPESCSRSCFVRGSAIARIAGQNAIRHPDEFDNHIPFWVFEEDVSHSETNKEPGMMGRYHSSKGRSSQT